VYICESPKATRAQKYLVVISVGLSFVKGYALNEFAEGER
jgi:hypothetical protein